MKYLAVAHLWEGLGVMDDTDEHVLSLALGQCALRDGEADGGVGEADPGPSRGHGGPLGEHGL